MEKLMVTHRLSLDMSNQAVQATITLAQYDTATHRLIVSLRHGAEVVQLPPGSYAAIAVQNHDAGVDVLDSVTVYGHDSVFPDCIVYDVSAYITQKEGFHEACFEVTHVDNGGLKLLSSPRIAFVVKPEMLHSSDVETSTKTKYYGAIVQAANDASTAKNEAQAARTAAEAARDTALSVGVGIKSIEQTLQSGEDGGKNKIVITMSNESTYEFYVMNGRKGDTGDQLVTFYLDYGTIEEMEAAVKDQTDDGVPVNGLVMIQKDPTIVDDDNATGRVYRKTLNENGTYYYKYMADLSGLQGPQGYTPVRGTDYWTDGDKDEIKKYVDEAILGGAW